MANNVTIKLDPTILRIARAEAKRQRRSLSAQVAVWITEKHEEQKGAKKA